MPVLFPRPSGEFPIPYTHSPQQTTHFTTTPSKSEQPQSNSLISQKRSQLYHTNMTIEFPTISLKTILPAVQCIMRALPEQTTIITTSSACEAAGYSLSSNYHLEFLRSAKQYGLIEYFPRRNTFQLTPFMIKNFPITHPPTHTALRSAALAPLVFTELHEYFNGDLIVPPAAVIRALSQQYDIPDYRKRSLAIAFSATMRYIHDTQPHTRNIYQTLTSPDGRVTVHFPAVS